MKLYVVRHGETDMEKNRLIANVDEPLNECGISQAINLGFELRNRKIDTIYCSPIERAKNTLELFKLDKNIPIIIEDRLKERDMGVYEGVKFEDLDWKIFWGYDSDLQYSKLESMKNVYKRIADFLDELRSKEMNKNILLVTHGGVARAIYWYFKGFGNSLFKCENCKIYEYNID